MKKIVIFLLAAVILTVPLTALAQNADTTASRDLVTRSRELVADLSAGEFTAAVAGFDSTMKAAMPPEKFAESWKTLQAQVGVFKSQGAARQEKVAQYDVVYVTCEFEKMPLEIKLVFNGAGQVAGLFFAPVTVKVEYETPSYTDTKAFRQTEVAVGSGEWSLPGTITMPWGNRLLPAVVLVHGSGPNDRDETIGPNKPFRDLAEGLSSRGIAVLRYDKRTMKYGEKVVAMIESLTVKEETVDDALAAVETLRRTRGIDTTRIFVLGHSLGGTLIPRIAAADRNIAGFIIMAGMARPLEDAVLDQYSYIFSLDGAISPEEQAELDKMKTQVARLKGPDLTASTPSGDLPLGLPAAYWLDLKGYKPADSARDIEKPMFIIQGGRDYQVTNDDFDLWKKALGDRKNVEFKLYPEFNHLFISGQGKITPGEYSQPGHVNQTVIDDISNWVIKH